MIDARFHAAVTRGLAEQLLSWIAERPRTYAEAMEAWSTHCPAFPVWEDALAERLVRVCPRPGGMAAGSVEITAAGLSRLKAAR
jgi:hypothetical protein